MSHTRSAAPAIAVLVVLTATAVGVRVDGQSTRPSAPPKAAQKDTGPARRSLATAAPATAEKQKALIDRSCVTCHNNRVKTANLSLEGLDFARVGDRAELWEKVVRKLRAGVMPPPDVRRPPLADYEGLRDWLEGEIDRHAATQSNPGAVVLHRLNRTEYAHAVRDLLDLEIDVTALLPPDDIARGSTTSPGR